VWLAGIPIKVPAHTGFNDQKMVLPHRQRHPDSANRACLIACDAAMGAFVVAVLEERDRRAPRTAEVIAAKRDGHGELPHHGTSVRRRW
jgi:hypothetical protein